MKKLKLLSLLTAAALLAGCATSTVEKDEPSTDATGTTTEATENLEITLWHGYSTAQSEQLEIFVEEYNALNEGVTIVPTFVANSEEILTKAQAALMTDEQPDILWGAPTMTGPLASSGKLVDLTDMIDDEWKSDIPEGVWNVGSLDGKLYSVPIEVGTLLLIYNQDMFDAAGIENPPTTWEEFYEVSKALTNDDHKGVWMPIDPNERTTWTWLCFLAQNGGYLLNEDQTALGFDRETLIETLEYYNSFIKDGIAPTTVGDDAFAEESVAMIIGTQGAAKGYINTYEMNIGVTMLAGHDQLATGLGTNHYYVFDNGEREVEESLKFLKWMTSGDTHANWAANAGYLPASNSASTSEAWTTFTADKDYLNTAAEALNYGFGRPSIEEYSSISNTISGVIEKLAYDAISVEDGADEIIEEINKALED